MVEMNSRKAAIIGCGFVGSASAFSLMESHLFSEIVLIDADKDRAEGEALDISHGLPFSKPMQIYAGTYQDISDAAVVIVTAGAGQKPGETRLDSGILLIVANPVDILTYVAKQLSGYPSNRVFGSGTVLDTARLKYMLGEHLGVDSRSIHAFIIGEHGDSEIAAWSSANVSGVPLFKFCNMRGHFHEEETSRRIAEEVKNSAYEIIKRKKATYYGIAMSVKRICEAIVRDEKSILPVSSIQNSEKINGVALSMPAIVGKHGVEGQVPIELSDEERAALQRSADTLKAVLNDVLEEE